MSDNGGLSAVARGGDPHTHNKPLSSGKGSVREGGIREPFYFRFPEVIAANSTCDIPVSGIDFYPTLLELADIPIPVEQVIDGKSLVPLLNKEENR